jgi:TonB family protein
MQYYEADSNKGGKRAGIIAVIVYIAVLALLFFLVKINNETPHGEEGILIDFGTTDTGSGALAASLAMPSTPASASDDIMTQDFEDAPAVTQEQPDNRTTQVEETPPQREVNQRALFPGQSAEQSSASQGNGTTAGNQGSPFGSEGGALDGTGMGTEGHSFNLSGRQLREHLPNPPQIGRNKSGTVVIEITVNSAGDVVSALPIAHGSTTNDGELIRAAQEAAMKAKFNSIDGNQPQKGTITYIFKLN